MRDWGDVLPPEIVIAQERWSFRHRILAARKAGATLNEIAGSIGRSIERVRQLAARAERELNFGFKSPAENFFAQVGLGTPIKFSRPPEKARLTPEEFDKRLRDVKRRHDYIKETAEREAAARRAQMRENLVEHDWRLLPRGRPIRGEVELRRLRALQLLLPDRGELKYRIADIENRIIEHARKQ